MHKGIEKLKERRAQRTADQAVLWRELDTIIEIMEDVMAASATVAEALAKVEQFEQERDAAQKAALSDLESEVATLRNNGVDTTGLTTKLDALGATIQQGTADAKAADPGAQQTPSAPPATRSAYTFAGDASTINHERWPVPSPPVKGSAGEQLYWFVEDTAPGDAKGNGVEGFTLYTGTQVAV